MNANEEREVFRGHLDECVKHLAGRLQARLPVGSKGLAKARTPIAEFCGVAETTVKQWLSEREAMPTGKQRLKLMCFLDLQRYRVIELERMKKGRRGFFELIGYGLLSPDQAAKLIGFKLSQAVYRVLLGRDGTSDEKEQKMWEAWKERKEELARKKEEAQSRFHLDWIEDLPTSVKKPAVERAPVQSLSAASKGTLRIMEGLLVLLVGGALKELSPSELAGLGQSGSETILRLSAQLSTLSSKLLSFDQRQRKGSS